MLLKLLNSSLSYIGGRGEPQNLDNVAVVSRGISLTGLQNFAKISTEHCGPRIITDKLRGRRSDCKVK